MQEGGAEEGAKKKVSAPADINNQIYISYVNLEFSLPEFRGGHCQSMNWKPLV
jgi:hypothetical protein